MQPTRLFPLSLAVVLILAISGSAATQNASIYGSVYSHTGAPMPGVTVQIQNAGTAFMRTTITGSDGSYSFVEVPPAEGYELTATISGKKIDIRTGVTVNVGDERVILPPLQEQTPATAPGRAEPAAKTQVTKRAVSTETVSTAVSGVITGDQLRSLPLYNRNFLTLGTLTPNTHETDAASELRGASFSVAGARPNQNNFLLDGTDNVASSSNQAVPFQVNDSIQEFRVISSLAPAEYGRNAGGVVNVVTRRAGQGFHGSAFGYFGSDALNADTPLSVYRGGTTFDRAAAYAGPTNAAPLLAAFAGPATYNEYVATAENRGFCTDSIGLASSSVACINTGGARGENTRFDPAALLAGHDSFTRPWDSKQFGVNAGGALIKDKLFLFGSYEGTRIDNPNPIFERVPSTFDRTYNPLGDASSPRVIPTGGAFGFSNSAIDYALARNIMALYPAANVIGVPDALEFYQGFAPNYTNVDNGLVRLDWAKSERTNITFRYVIQGLNQLHDDSLPEQAQYAGNGAVRDAVNQNFNVSMTRTWGSNIVNEARLAFTRFRVKETPQDEGLDATTIGLPNPQMMTFLLSGLDTQYSGATPNTPFTQAMGGWADSFWSGASPIMPTLDGQFPMARIGAPLNAPGQRRDDNWLFADTVSITKGRHGFKFGGEIRWLRNRFVNGGLSRGYAIASDIGEFTSDSASCNSCGEAFGVGLSFPSFDYALRQPESYSSNLRSWTMAGFLQDTFRLHRRVTVNLGLRYEFFSVPNERNDNLWNFDPVANGLVRAGTTAVVDPYGTPCAPLVNDYSEYAAAFFAVPDAWACSGSGNGRMAGRDMNNFGPRVGVAWDVFGTGKTVVRSGIGLYYDQSPVSYLAQLAYNRPTKFNANNPQAIYGQNFLAGGCFSCGLGNTIVDPAEIVALGWQDFASAASPMAIYARDVEHSSNPMTRQISASVQQSVTGTLAVELGYVGISARHLPVIYNAGFENEWFCTSMPGGCAALDVNHNFPVLTMTNRGGAAYHSLMARVRAAEWHGLRVNATYNWSKGIDNASNSVFPLITNTLFNQALGFQIMANGNPSGICQAFGPAVLPPGPGCGLVSGGAGISNLQSPLTTTGAGEVFTTPYLLPQDPVGLNFLADDRGRSDFDSTHRLVLDYTFDVPSLRKGSKLWDGWQLSGIFTAQSGQPFTIFAGPVVGEVTQRVSLTGDVAIDTGNPDAMIATSNLALPGASCALAPNGNAFAVPAAGNALFDGNPGAACVGNSKRNGFTGPAFINMNFAVQKSTPLFGEGRVLTLRAEFYNLFNRANYYNPISTLSLDGVSRNPDFGVAKSAHDPRQIQFAARFRW